MRRFHLLSFIVAMLVAGVLLGVNFRGNWRRDDQRLPYIAEYGFYEYGWPTKCAIYEALTVIPHETKEYDQEDLKYVASNLLQKNTDQYLQIVPVKNGLLFVTPNRRILWEFLTINVLILLSASTLALFACESFLRRRESRAHAS